jgi:hypothetical protein
MKRIIIPVLSFVIALAVGCSSDQKEAYAVINFILGDVTVNDSTVEIGYVLNEEDVINTGSDSFCDVKIGGSIIRVKEKTKMVLSRILKSQDNENTTLDLDSGKMLCKPKKLLKNESFVVKTPTAVAGVRGTQFTVEADQAKTTRIKVYDGKVQIARRVKQLEGATDRMLEIAPTLETKQKIIITEKEVREAEKRVDQVLKNVKDANSEEAIQLVLKESRKEIAVNTADIETFSAEDFALETREIIEIKEKPKEVVKRIKKVIQQEKAMPKPDGRLLITRYEVYFIKNGKVKWEGRVEGKPIRKNGRIYVASGEYVFCASEKGPVLWRKNIINNGTVDFKDGALQVYTKDTTHRLDPETGQQL